MTAKQKDMTPTTRIFAVSILTTVVGLAVASAVGWAESRSAAGALEALFIAAVLGVLEVSLSFDNAVVNAKVLRQMNEIWRRRFLTWGILIAVFGMRLLFPLLVVGFAARLWPWDALLLAARDPQAYAQTMLSAHVEVAAFGGAFLLMVALRFFLDAEKEAHWIGWLETPLQRMGRAPFLALAVAATAVAGLASAQPAEDRVRCGIAGALGLATFMGVDLLMLFLKREDATKGDDNGRALARSSAGLFIYLEVLDASFSFDGVVGAFAVTNSLFVIAIGLGIGAMFVRSLTIWMVELGALEKFRFLEHGAFYAIAGLAACLFVGTLHEIPEAVPGGISALILGLAYWSSTRANRATKLTGT